MHECVRACSVTQSCLTLCNPVDYSPPGSSVHGISQARILQWAAISFSRGLFPTQESNLCLLSLLPQAGSLPPYHQGAMKTKHTRIDTTP